MYRWPYTPSSGRSRRSRGISAGRSIGRKSDKQFGGLTKDELALGIVALQSSSVELLAGDAHDDSVDEFTVLERTLAKRGIDGEPARVVRAERPLVRCERPQLHHVQIQAVERVGEQGPDGVLPIALPPCAGLTDIDVQRTDAVPAPELIQPDLAHGQPLSLDDERVPPRARAFLGFRSEEHTSELQSRENLVCRLLREKKKKGGGEDVVVGEKEAVEGGSVHDETC